LRCHLSAAGMAMPVTVHKPQNTKDDTFMIRIANDDKENAWITLHFQSLEDAKEARVQLKKIMKVGAHNM
jgi:hypothetical protein